jgi:hypothetical protein
MDSWALAAPCGILEEEGDAATHDTDPIETVGVVEEEQRPVRPAPKPLRRWRWSRASSVKEE